MEKEKQRLLYRSLADGKETPWQTATTLDELIWEGPYSIKLTDGESTFTLPLSINPGEIASLLVKDSAPDSKLSTARTTVQTLSHTNSPTGILERCTRSCTYKNNKPVWSKWENPGSNDSGINVSWGTASNINNYTTQGTYIITGERSNANDNLPIENSAPGHTISARLFVLDSSINPQEVCVTQVLMIGNRLGNDGNTYIRTGNATSIAALQSASSSQWGKWGKLQQNIEVGQTASFNTYIDNGIYSGVYTNGNTQFETFVMVVINNYAIAGATGRTRSISQFKYALNIDGTFSYNTRTGQGNNTITWGSWVALNAATTTDILDNSVTAQKLSSDVREKIEKTDTLEKNIAKEKTALINGDTIVGVARDVYSRQGKTDTATFLRRTTAGGTSISDGVASIKHIGGYCVKNLIDGTFADSTTYKGDVTNITIIGNGIIKISSVTNMPYSAIYHQYQSFSHTHIYYNYAEVLIKSGKSVTISINGCTTGTTSREIGIWHSLSAYGKNTTELKNACIRVTNNDNNEAVAYIKRWFILDLTEMYGDGNEPTKEECDKMFATMGTLPQGITVAQPTGFKSIGFNQWNPANKLEGKGIINNTITDAETDIAFMECLPCKVGTGENNGYIIGYGEGDSWNDTGVEVYFSPNSVFDTDGTYIQKLTKDATYNTYVPRVAGYLFIVTPTTEKLCAHLHWSGDREVTDYEEYVESNVTLPTISQMSEWGLAGLVSVKDTIDLDENKYTKTIDRINLKEATFSKITRYWRAYVSREQTVYSNVDFSVGGLQFYTDINNGEKIEGDYNNVTDVFTDTNGVAYARAENYDMPKNLFFITLPNLNPSGFDTSKKPIALSGYFSTEKYTKSIFSNNALFFAFNKLGITHTANSVEDLKSSLAGMPDNDTMLYYPATPVEYPIVTKAAPNYIGSDYGVEQFTGSKVPLATNILFYMRSLVSETRNFLDRLYKNADKSETKEVADYITNGIEGNKELATNAPNLALRALFIAIGAEYNDTESDKTKTTSWGETIIHKAGHYNLNGLGDITEEEMAAIYAANKMVYSNNISGIYFKNTNIRTNICRYGVGWQEGDGVTNASRAFYGATNIEIAVIANPNWSTDNVYCFQAGYISSMFDFCTKLREIKGIISCASKKSDGFLYAFRNCGALVSVKIYKLYQSISFKDSPLINEESLVYIIENADPQSAITITLHPNAYTRLINNVNIVNALEKQPLITIVSI